VERDWTVAKAWLLQRLSCPLAHFGPPPHAFETAWNPVVRRAQKSASGMTITKCCFPVLRTLAL
jgi:hypothetical protein